ncbi:hypothetical protein AXY1_36 [Achromobacter phage AXY1]|nr:hypothetical protein AXY1_36 [Achromobacter phage AXY1]
MSKNMQIRFKGGPKDGCVLRVPMYTKVNDTISRFNVPLVGHYEVTTRSPAGEHVIVTWKEPIVGQPMPERSVTVHGSTDTLMLAGMLEALAAELRKPGSVIVAGGLHHHLVPAAPGNVNDHIKISSDLVVEIKG